MERDRFPNLIKGIIIATIVSIIAISVSDALASVLMTKISNVAGIVDQINDDATDDSTVDDTADNTDENSDTNTEDNNDKTQDTTDFKFDTKATSLMRYNLLDNEEKEMYKELYVAMMNVETFKKTVTYSKGKDKIEKTLNTIVDYVITDNPKIFYTFGGGAYSIEPAGKNKYEIEMEFDYYTTKQKANEYRAMMDKKINDILSQKDFTGCSDFEKAVWCYEWLCKNVEYNNEIINDKDNKIKDKNIIWRAYGAFSKGSTVCMGYAEAFQMMMYKLNVPCTTVGGICKDGQGHEWNVATIDGVNTHIDVTWADQITVIDYSQFGMTDSQVSKDRKKNTYWPKCTSTAASYYAHNKNKKQSAPNSKKMVHYTFSNFNNIRHPKRVLITTGE